MSLGELVVSSSDLLSSRVVLTLSVGVQLSKTLNFVLILNSLFLKLADFKEEIIYVLAKLIALISLKSNVSLKARDIDLLASNLISGCSEVLLTISNDAALLVKKEAEIVHLFLEANDSHLVGVVLHSEVVVLQQL